MQYTSAYQYVCLHNNSKSTSLLVADSPDSTLSSFNSNTTKFTDFDKYNPLKGSYDYPVPSRGRQSQGSPLDQIKSAVSYKLSTDFVEKLSQAIPGTPS